MKNSKIILKIILFITLSFILFQGCSSNDDDLNDSDSQSLTEQEVHQIKVNLVDIIIASGRDFPQYEDNQGRPIKTNNLNDFLEGPNNYLETQNEPGELKFSLWLDNQGNIIPSPTWQQNNPDYCLNYGFSMRAPKKLLRFKVAYEMDYGLSHPNEFAYYVQLELTDVETGVINQAVEIPPIIDENNNWVNATMNEAWNQMLDLTTIQGAVGPCEGDIALTLFFETKMTTNLSDSEGTTIYFEHVTAIVDLGFDQENKTYYGARDLIWVDSWVQYSDGEGGITEVPGFFTGLIGEFKVITLSTPEMSLDNNNYPFPGMDMTLNAPNITPFWKIAWPLLYDWDADETEVNFHLWDNWETPEAPSAIVMQLSNNRTESFQVDGDPIIITENTNIEVRRD